MNGLSGAALIREYRQSACSPSALGAGTARPALSHKLTVWVGNVLIQSGWLVRAVPNGKDLKHPEQRANDAHETATSHADQLAERIRLQTAR